jgi:polyphenol oxidase
MTLPVVPAPFYWTEESWGPALRCRAIDEVAAGLFTTRTLQLSSDADWARIADAVGAPTVVTVTQVHGNRAVVLRRGQGLPEGRPEADVLVSERPDVAIAVRAADCVPILIADQRTGAVAAVHAGWRGTAAGAARIAVETLGEAFGANPADLRVAIGPSIAECCYEVGAELREAFATAGHPLDLIDRWFVSRSVGDTKRQRLSLDVAGANRDQLILAGVNPDAIYTAGLCTAMHLDLLTSFRVEKERAGRLAGVIKTRG